MGILTELFLAALIAVILSLTTLTATLSAQDDVNGPMAEFDSFLGESSDTSDEGREPGGGNEGLEFPDSSDSSNDAYEKFKGCLSDLEGELNVLSPREQQVRECFESSYNANGNDNSRENGQVLR